MLHLGFDIANCVRALDVQGERLACVRLDVDLHPSAEAEVPPPPRRRRWYNVELVILLDVVV